MGSGGELVRVQHLLEDSMQRGWGCSGVHPPSSLHADSSPCHGDSQRWGLGLRGISGETQTLGLFF